MENLSSWERLEAALHPQSRDLALQCNLREDSVELERVSFSNTCNQDIDGTKLRHGLRFNVRFVELDPPK